MAIFGDSGIAAYIPNVSAPRYTQDFCEIDRIDNGMVITKDKRYLKILEIKPINFYSKSPMERDLIIGSFASWLKISPVSFQIKVLTKRADPTELIERARNAVEVNKDKFVERAVNHYIDLLHRVAQYGAITKKFYLVIQYEPQTQAQKNFTELQIADAMDNTVSQIQSMFREMGNIVQYIDEKDQAHKRDNEDWELGELFYALYNPRTSKDEQGRHAVTLNERVSRVLDDFEKAGNPNIDMASFFAPKGIDLEQKGCVIIDGLYYTSFAIAGNGYPIRTYGGWMGEILGRIEPGDCVDMFFRKENPERMLTKVTQKLRFTIDKLSSRTVASKDSEQVASARESGEYIKAQINANGEMPFYFSLIITLSGERYNELMERKAQLTGMLTARGFGVEDFARTQEDVVRSTYPLLSLDPKVYNRIKRNVLSCDLASCYPFTAFQIQNDDGFLLGINQQNATATLLNPYDTAMYTNANMVILGTSGAGKTFTECTIALRLRELGTQCFVIAPWKAHEFHRGCMQLGGEFITIAPSSKNHINIMEVRPRVSASADILEGASASSTSIVADKAQVVSTFIELTCPSVTKKILGTLDSCVLKTYRKFGLTLDNDSIYVDNDPEKGLKEMPIIGDLYQTLQENNKNGDLDDLINDMEQFIYGRYSGFNNKTNVDLRNKFIVFDVSKLDDSIQAGGMFIVLDFIMGRIKEDILERKIVFMDEGWKLIGANANSQAAKYIIDLFKTIRGYNGSACIATQDINDFFAVDDGKYGRAILGNSEIKFVLKMKESEADHVAEAVGLTPEETRRTLNFDKGQCIFLAGKNHIPIQIVASRYIEKLFTTDPKLIEDVVREMQENGGAIL